MRNSKVKVSLACPGMVDTAISTADRNWPEYLGERPSVFDTRTAMVIQKRHQRALSRSMGPHAAAEIIIEGMQSDRFWVFTDDVYANDITAHADVAQPPSAPKYL
jgi:short-subunit dehydrogenase